MNSERIFRKEGERVKCGIHPFIFCNDKDYTGNDSVLGNLLSSASRSVRIFQILADFRLVMGEEKIEEPVLQ